MLARLRPWSSAARVLRAKQAHHWRLSLSTRCLAMPPFSSPQDDKLAPSQLNLEPVVAMEKLIKIGIHRADRDPSVILTGSMVAGGMISVGGAMLVLTAGGVDPSVASQVPGLVSLLGGLVFPVGLVWITLAGQDLLTSNMLYSALPFFDSRPVREAAQSTSTKIRNYLKVFTLSALGNSAGCLVMAAGCASYLFLPGTPYAAFAAALATKKCSLTIGGAIAKGIFANWLVNIAVYSQSTTESTAGKIVAIWLPVTVFVALGLEHSVANVFLVPLGMLSGADISMQDFVLNNLLPVTFGNILGAAGMVGWLQRYATLAPTLEDEHGEAITSSQTLR